MRFLLPLMDGKLTIDISPISNKLNTTCLPRAVRPIFSSFLIFTPVKHEKLRQYWSYCTQDSEITNACTITYS